MQVDSSSIQGGDSEDDFDWEEVEVPMAEQQSAPISMTDTPIASGSSTPAANIEITIRAKPQQDDSAK